MNRIRAKNKSTFNHDVKTLSQSKLNNLHKGTPFDMTLNYAFAVNTILVTMFYCSGMPILLLLASFQFTLKYNIDKWLVLKYYSRPQLNDERQQQLVNEFLPVSVILHCAIALFAYTCQQVFPNKGKTTLEVDESLKSLGIYSIVMKSKNQELLVTDPTDNRFSPIDVYYIAFGVIAFLYVVFLLMRIVKVFCYSPVDAKIHDSKKIDNTSLYPEVKQVIRRKALQIYDHTYDITQNPDYGRVVAAMNGLEYQIPEEVLIVEDLRVLKELDEKVYEQWTLDKVMSHY